MPRKAPVRIITVAVIILCNLESFASTIDIKEIKLRYTDASTLKSENENKYTKGNHLLVFVSLKCRKTLNTRHPQFRLLSHFFLLF